MVKSKPKICILIPVQLLLCFTNENIQNVTEGLQAVWCHEETFPNVTDTYYIHSDLYSDNLHTRATVVLKQAECIILHNLFLFLRNWVFKTEVWIGIKTSGPEAFKTTYKEETLLNDKSLPVFPHVYKGTLPLFKPRVMHNS